MQPALRPINANQFELVEDWSYQAKFETFHLPKGFVTDLASVPKFLWWFIPSYGNFLHAALVHDYLWALARKQEFKFEDADGIFKRILRELGVSISQRWVMYAAVRVMHPKTLFANGDGLRIILTALLALTALAIPTAAVLVFSILFKLIGAITARLEPSR